jgi:phenylalanyl-tRNA synthetase beta chain
VATGQGDPVQIVCGAANARAGLKSALAIVGAKLPGDLTIKASKLRGVESFGMLASAKELGLTEVSAGILELPADAPVGQPLRDYLGLDDTILDLAVTPNRGDAMSVIGMAREVAALTGKALKASEHAAAVTDADGSSVAVHLDAPAACPTFVGCVIRGVNNRATTPIWLRERLRRAGVRSISPVVDITNYVMLELGQPMHAYDLAKLRGDMHVRTAKEGEPITLLDGKTIETQSDVLLIADAEGPVGLAGIMGGERTSITADTMDLYFEAAYFTPQAVAGRARRWGLTTDASQRFERGVDPTQQSRAMRRAISLLQSIAGGTTGPVSVTQSVEHQVRRGVVPLRRSRLKRLLGVELADERVAATLTALQMKVTPTAEGWEVTPPAHRFDIAIEADLIEEVARIVGYQEIPERAAANLQRFRSLPEESPSERVILEALAMRGWEEAITFAFVDPALQAQLFPDRTGLVLANALSSDLSVMRLSLWPGLVRAALENQRRQQDRIRLFEHGAKFVMSDPAGDHRPGGGSASPNGGVAALGGAVVVLSVAGIVPAGGTGVVGATITREVDSLAGIAAGLRLPEQWGLPGEARVPVDFYDVKGDIEALLDATGQRESFVFEAASLSCLHPGRAARIVREGREIGWLGELHPSLVRELGFVHSPVLFELETAALVVRKPQYHEISRFPQVRRDLAIVVDESVSLSTLVNVVAKRVTLSGSNVLRDVRIFDVYRGPGVEIGTKSVALGLIFQDISRTLTDEDVERLMASVVTDLRVVLNARIRE